MFISTPDHPLLRITGDGYAVSAPDTLDLLLGAFGSESRHHRPHIPVALLQPLSISECPELNPENVTSRDVFAGLEVPGKRRGNWIDIDLELPTGVDDVDALHARVIELLPKIARKLAEVGVELSPEQIDKSLMVDARQFYPRVQIDKLKQGEYFLGRDRIYGLLVDGHLITFHHGNNRVIEIMSQPQVAEQLGSPERPLHPALLFLSLFHQCSEMTRKTMTHIEKRVVERIEKELSQPDGLSARTISNDMPAATHALNFLQRKIGEAGEMLSRIQRRFVNDAELDGETRRAIGARVTEIAEDIRGIASRASGAKEQLSQVQRSNDALLKRNENTLAEEARKSDALMAEQKRASERRAQRLLQNITLAISGLGLLQIASPVTLLPERWQWVGSAVCVLLSFGTLAFATRNGLIQFGDSDSSHE